MAAYAFDVVYYLASVSGQTSVHDGDTFIAIDEVCVGASDPRNKVDTVRYLQPVCPTRFLQLLVQKSSQRRIDLLASGVI